MPTLVGRVHWKGATAGLHSSATVSYGQQAARSTPIKLFLYANENRCNDRSTGASGRSFHMFAAHDMFVIP